MLRAATAALLVLVAVNSSRSADAEPMIGHMVYFALKDSSAAERTKLVEACKKYLKEHDGVVFFAAGPRSEEFKRDVNDQDWDVALHLVFKNKAAHDKYQEHKLHKQFIDENKANWKKVRVFDSAIGAK